MTHPASSTPAGPPDEATRRVDLDVTGMTCASCVGRVERKLGKLEGVTASVNLPLEQATVTAPAGVSDEELMAAVEKAGYGATVRRPAPPAGQAGHAGHAHTSEHGEGHGEEHAADHDGVDHHDHMAHGPSEDVLKPRLIGAALLTVPLVLISMVPALQFPHWGWVAFALAAPVALWAAWPFHSAAFRAARHGSSTMDTLVSLGVLVSFSFSAVELILAPDMTAHVGGTMAEMAHHSLYFEAAAVITTFLLLGRWLEARAKREAGAALRALLDLGAARATLYDPETHDERTVPAESLAPGDVVLIRPGEKVPTDAEVLEGTSAVDASLLTGESVPVEVGPGDALTGATLNTSGRLVARATRVGSDTTLAQMGRLVSEAQTGKARVARLADRISAVFVPIVLGIAVLTFAVWMLVTGDLPSALRAGVAVLVIACPCALGLATPVGLLAGTGRASQLGILIRGPEVLEDSRTVDTIVLDKTGTVTEGRMALADVLVLDPAFVTDTGASRSASVAETDAPRSASVAETAPDRAADRLLTLAAAVERGSEHPIARAIVTGAEERGLTVPDVADFASTAGGGVSGLVALPHDDGALASGAHGALASGAHGALASGAHGAADPAPVRVAVGRGSVLETALDGGIPAEHRAAFKAAEQAGATAVWVAVGGRVAGVLSVRDTVKDTSADAIARLRQMGLRPLLVTGDNAAVATDVADAVGIPAADVVAGVHPEDKVGVVTRLQSEGAVVAMVGDGVNDAPALAAADMGIAMGSGTDVAREAAQITVMGDDLHQVVQALDLSRRTLGIIRMNLFWAFLYNVLGIPVAALGLLNPMIAGGAMAASSVLVVLNSLRLTRYAR
ncbi:heavy metal translocating P-type ATPase [Micrococcus luteus]|uniref:heavy metal translocating P-type ATPase n=1 Tax=Micrococcus luteus TaxID=1270 RepID=UPI0015D6B304|nr:heavy metal translocating P-type ATPase [Micrococcus luteus]